MNRDQLSAVLNADRYCVLSLALAVIWFCQDLVLTDSVPFFRDLSTYFYPLRFSLFESYRSGSIPLWNRHMAAGFPVLAGFQSGTFYPPHLIFFVLSFFTAIRALFVFHFLVAAVGAFVLLRAWKLSRPLSVVGALLFAFGGITVSLTNLLNHFQTAVWLPSMLLFWERAVRSLSWNNFLVFGLVSTIAFVAGSPELYTLNIALVALDGFRLKGLAPSISCGRMATVLILANLMVLALAMVQVAPTAELFLQSRRQQWIPAQEALKWSLNPASLLNLFFLDKETSPAVPSGLRLFFAREAPFFVSYYLGTATALGVWFWLFLDSWRARLVVLGLVFAFLILALGSHTPVYGFLYQHLQVLRLVRFPEKFFYVAYLLLLYAALKGLGLLPATDPKQSRKIALAAGVLFVMCLGAYFFFRFNVGVVAQMILAKTGVSPGSTTHTQMIAAVLANIEKQAFLAIALLVLVCLVVKDKVRQNIFSLLLICVVFVDLAWAHRSFLFPLDPDFIETSPRILQQPDIGRNRLFYYPSAHNLHPSQFVIRGQPTFNETTALFLQNLLPNEGVFHGVDYFQEIDALARRPYTEFLAFANPLDGSSQIKLLRTFNINYLVSFNQVSAKGLSLVGQVPQYLSWLYLVQDSVPRAYVVKKAIVETDPAKILTRLASADFDPLREVILDSEVPVEMHGPTAATARILNYENQSVVVNVTLDEAGILVLADSYYPGWKAYVDGTETKILRANLFFRAVALSGGDHLVEFRYQPWSFRIGLAISLTTIFALIVTTVIGVLRKRREKALISIS